MRLDQKIQIVDEFNDKFTRSKVVIATSYTGLNVAQMSQLRRKLLESGSEYHVVKNTLLVRASTGNDIEVLQDLFNGTTGVALNYTDPVAPAKVLMDFAKDNEKLVIKGGSLNGKRISFDGIQALATLPSREALLGQLLSVMNGVPTAFVRVLSNIPQNFMNVLSAIKDQKENAAN